MAIGRPVIATDLPALAEVLDAPHGAARGRRGRLRLGGRG
ncbi:hypothetical protein NKG05_19000 [Oerskovia sp. M15]